MAGCGLLILHVYKNNCSDYASYKRDPTKSGSKYAPRHWTA